MKNTLNITSLLVLAALLLLPALGFAQGSDSVATEGGALSEFFRLVRVAQEGVNAFYVLMAAAGAYFFVTGLWGIKTSMGERGVDPEKRKSAVISMTIGIALVLAGYLLAATATEVEGAKDGAERAAEYLDGDF